MAKINYEIISDSNFLRSMDYMAGLSGLIKNLEVEFILAEHINIAFEETINFNPNIAIQNVLDVLDDGKKINLRYIKSRYNLGNGKISEPPSPKSFLDGFEFFMKNTVIKEDKERYDNLINN